jgi:CDP-glycerol glycerophosphotransferase
MRVGLAARNLRRYALVPLYPLVWPLAHLLPRRPGLWVFAYVHGYKDNPRYQLEQVVAAAPRGVRPVWFAQSRQEAAAVRATGREAVWKRSPRAWWLQARAGVAVLGSGPSELNRPLMGGAKVVQLWHGAPFKKIHADFPQGDVLLGGSSLVARVVDGFVRRATNATRKVDLLPSQSEVVSTRYQSAFQIGPEQTPVIGTPRGDIIGATGPEADAEAHRARTALLPAHLADVPRLVLYAPTWRDGVDEAFLADGLDVEALDAVLEELDAVMLIRLHPQGNRAVFDDAGVTSTKRVVLQRGGADVDVNVLLRAVDCLLTDYSAISVDHALLGRPIVYFMPDLEEYGSGRGTYEPPQAMTGGLECRTWPEVLSALRAAFTDPGPYVAAAEAARDRYWTHRDTQSCARITAATLALAGLPPIS